MSSEHDHDSDHEPHGVAGHGHGQPGHGHGHHEHAHGHHEHAHTPKTFGRAFAIGIGVQTAFVLAEVIAGLAAHSLAVLSDAGHNVSDVLALALAWGATHLGRRKSTKGRTYGLKSASILTAIVNSLTLIFVNGAVAWEAILRLRDPEPVAALTMIVVSLVGVMVNGFSAWLFAKDSAGDVNVRAVFVHLMSDAAVAAGVATTGIVIHYTGLFWLDPVASLVVSAVVVVTAWSLVRRAVDLAMQAVPDGIDEDVVREWLVALPGVTEVHDLHIWAMSTSENVLTAHLEVQAMPAGALACDIDAKLRGAFPVHHVTIQIDPMGSNCALAGDEVV
jgi:cobalt-zinc-cadmium efflux system protein